MDIKDLKRWIRLKIKTIDTAREACLNQGDAHHRSGREPVPEETKKEHWSEAERYHAAAKDIRDAQHEEDMPNMRQCSDDSIHGNSAPIQVTRLAPHIQKVEISERTLTVIAFGMSVAAFVIALWANQKASTTELTAVRELKQVQIQLMYTNALMIREGLVKPGDMVYGPEGNLEYNGKSFKPKER